MYQAQAAAAKGLVADFRLRQERSAMREDMLKRTANWVPARPPRAFLKQAADHAPVTLKKSRR